MIDKNRDNSLYEYGYKKGRKDIIEKFKYIISIAIIYDEKKRFDTWSKKEVKQFINKIIKKVGE